LVFPNYIYTFYKDEGDPEEVISRMEVSFHKCFFRSATSYGRSLFPFFPMGRSYASYGVHSRRDHAWNSASFFFDNEKNAPRRVFKETIKSPRVIASTETISHLDSGSEVVAEEGTPFFSSSHAFRALNPQGFKSRYSLQHCRYSFFKSFKARRLAP